MKNLCQPEIARWRNHEADAIYGTRDEDRAYGGAFEIPFRKKGTIIVIWLRVIASRDDGQDSGVGWDHVSVSTQTRCPTWKEMCFIKELFFRPDEPAMQLHPVADYVNNHPCCLHLWRPVSGPIPLPPAHLVGIPGLEFAA